MASRVTRRLLLLSALAAVPALALAPVPSEAQPAPGGSAPTKKELRAQKRRLKRLRAKQKRLIKRQRAHQAR